MKIQKLNVAGANKGNPTDLDPEQEAAISGVDGSAGKADDNALLLPKTGQQVTQNAGAYYITGQDSSLPNANFSTMAVGAAPTLKPNPLSSETGEMTYLDPNPVNDFAAVMSLNQNSNNVRKAGVSQGAMPRIPDDTTCSTFHVGADMSTIEGTAVINLVTSRKQRLSKQKESLKTIGGISLVAGNATDSLNAIVLDEPLREYLNSMAEIVQKLADSVHVFAKHQFDLNSVVAKHGHPDLLNMIVSLSAQMGLTAIANGSTLKNKDVFKEAMKANENILKVLADCETHRENVDLANNKHLARHDRPIESQHNKST
tara:strand:+ start:1461 stop:2405 length:945 start_codon:yes stop_codon:yes gene_type:complete